MNLAILSFQSQINMLSIMIKIGKIIYNLKL